MRVDEESNMPEWKDEIKDRLASLNLDPAREAEIAEELSQHLEDRYAESLARGATPEEAYHAALAELRDTESLQQALRQVEREAPQEPVVLGATRRINMLGGVWQDLRYGARMLAKTPGFTLLAVLTLALGIGANTAIFSGVNAVLFRLLPATREPERLCHVNVGRRGVAYVEYEDFQARSQPLEGLAAYDGQTGRDAVWRFDGQYHTLRGVLVSGNYFRVLGGAAALGRVLAPEDEAAGAENAVVVSDATWRSHFAADPGIVGKQVFINDLGFTVVGVTAPVFQGPNQPFTPAWWIAAKKASTEPPNRFNDQWPDFNLIGRLKPGISPRQAQAEFAVILAGLKQLRPEAYKDRSVSVEPVRGFKRGVSGRSEVFLIMAIAIAVVGLTLLIACANISCFLLARAMNRRKEIAVRLALGASRWRIVRMLVAESLLLALMGGAAAAALSFWGANLLSYVSRLIIKGLSGGTLPDFDFTPDRLVFGATLLISLLVGIVCGLAPALQASKADLTARLKHEAGLLGSGYRRISWRNGLVVAQIAGALVLLAGSGLFIRSARQTLRLEPGFEARQLAFNRISLSSSPHPALEDWLFFRDLQRRVAASPEAQSICLAEGALLDGQGYGNRHKLQVDDPEQFPFGDREIASFSIGPNYFATVGIPLTRGRDFTERDLDRSSRVVIINETLARRAFPGQNPMGRQARLLSGLFGGNGEPLEIIGVAKDATHHKLGEEIEPILYLPLRQNFFDKSYDAVLIVRTRRDPAVILPSVAGMAKSFGPEVSISQSTVAENIARQTLAPRTASAFFGLFGALGLLLAAVGLSGALAYAVAQRAKEIGIRMALGASRAAVLRMIIGEGLALALAGVVIGLALALALTRALSSYLYGVSAADPLTYLATTLILIIVALLACYFPARRAAGVDPMTALRQE
jgi:putative ABC transport system permease protein